MTEKGGASMTQQFHWKEQPEAEALLQTYHSHCLEGNHSIAVFEEQLKKHASSRLFDWIDHYVIPNTPKGVAELESVGFTIDHASAHYRVFNHLGAQLPFVVVYDLDHRQGNKWGMALTVESVSDYLFVHHLSRPIEGSPFSLYRRALISEEQGISFWAVERRGSKTMTPQITNAEAIASYCIAKETWRARLRASPTESDDQLFDGTLECAEKMITLVGQDLAAWIVLEEERAYWQARNSAGQIQKNRQDRLGLGWGNHDHHTFRSSRGNFIKLVRLFEMLGFRTRERFWAGIEAGWGAQVMENSSCGLILFLDVDLAPEELNIDFSHNPMPERSELGTIGLWCALHGDSLLQAGMHHLEAQFLFDALTEELSHRGVGMMPPFSNFTFLKQAFTAGEIWPVEEWRITTLLQGGKITSEQAQKFHTYGAIGSHMENLQRRNGYKGFNQKNVSVIIKETDPRRASMA
jgi:hypothetical protein